MSKAGARAKRRALAAVPVAAPAGGAPIGKRYAPAPQISRLPSSLQFSDITWDVIQSAKQAASRGYTEQWVDFCRRMLTDPHLLSVYTTYVGAIAGARRELVPRAVAPELQRFSDLAAADCERMLSDLPNIERSIAEMVDADGVGLSVHEIIYEARADRVVPTQLVWLSQDRFRFSDYWEPFLWDRGAAAERAKELGIETTATIPGLPLTPRKYVVHIPRMKPDYGLLGGLFTSCDRYWYYKSNALRFWLSGAEASGSPRMLGHTADDATDAVREQLYSALASISADSVGVLSGESRIEVLDVKAQGSGSVWDTLTKVADSGFSKVWLGSTLNVEVGDTGGNRSLGESQADMTMSPRWARSSQLVANTIERDLFTPFLYFNRHRYGGHVFTPNLRLHIVEESAVIDDAVIAAGACTYDELRAAKNLEPWGPENGGDQRIPTASAAPAAAFSRSAEAAPAVPFQMSRALSAARPWSRAAKIAGATATATSTPSPTTPNESAQ